LPSGALNVWLPMKLGGPSALKQPFTLIETS